MLAGNDLNKVFHASHTALKSRVMYTMLGLKYTNKNIIYIVLYLKQLCFKGKIQTTTTTLQSKALTALHHFHTSIYVAHSSFDNVPLPHTHTLSSTHSCTHSIHAEDQACIISVS